MQIYSKWQLFQLRAALWKFQAWFRVLRKMHGPNNLKLVRAEAELRTLEANYKSMLDLTRAQRDIQKSQNFLSELEKADPLNKN